MTFASFFVYNWDSSVCFRCALFFFSVPFFIVFALFSTCSNIKTYYTSGCYYCCNTYPLEYSRLLRAEPIFFLHTIHSSHRNRICRKSVVVCVYWFFFISCTLSPLPLKMISKPYSHIRITVNILRLTVFVASCFCFASASMWFACVSPMAKNVIEQWHGSSAPSIECVSRESWRSKLAESHA